MNYQQCIDYLYSALPVYQRQGPAAYKDNLDNTLALDAYFEHPHKSFASVHLAGTNGKGSVSHMLASVLQAAGFRTGLYTSPHLLDFRERIRVNGECISENEVVAFVEAHRGMIKKLRPSFFELTVAMAFEHFAQQDVEIAVVETGLGGRLDSTNILDPELALITNISMDHMAFLGNDLLSIAREKGGIIKAGTPLVLGKAEGEVLELLQQMAAKKQAPFIHAGDQYQAVFRTLNADGSMQLRVFRKDGAAETQEGPEGEQLRNIHCDMTGSYQDENILTALTALDALRKMGWRISPEAQQKGMATIGKSTGLRGRWEQVGHNPRSICDTGHNQEGVRVLAEQIRQTPHKKLHMVWGMVGDKDIDEILALLPKEASYYFTPSSVPRSMDAFKLKAKAAAAGLEGRAFKSVKEAYTEARNAAGPDDMIFTGGSTFVVADLLSILGIKNT